MLLFPFENETFAVPDATKRLNHNFYFTHFLLGNWTGNGTDDLIVRKANGDLYFYPFENQTFDVSGAGKKVGE